MSCGVQEECKSLEEFSGIPIAKLKASDPSITELKFSNDGFGDAEACVLGMVLQVRHKIGLGHHTISTCILKPVSPPLTMLFVVISYRKTGAFLELICEATEISASRTRPPLEPLCR